MLVNKRILFTLVFILTIGLSNCFNCSYASDMNFENIELSKELNMPIYQWSDYQANHTKGIVLAIHGLIMHGGTYTGLGKSLKKEGYMVIATDLRGYGKLSNTTEHTYCTSSDCHQVIDYEKSFADLNKLAKAIKKTYPSIPLFVVGESLGADLAIRLAGRNPNLINGIILSAPAIKRQSFMDVHVIANVGFALVKPKCQIDLYHFVKSYTSNDPRIVEELLNDPFIRRTLSPTDLLKSTMTIRRTPKYVAGISPDTPVLVIQGSADRCVKANGVVVLLERLRSIDQTVRWFHERGHIILETAYIKPDALSVVVDWLKQHTDQMPYQAKTTKQGWDEKLSSQNPIIELLN